MISFLRMTRLPNLIIVVLTQYLLYYRVLLPSFRRHDVTPSLDALHFFLLVLATICIAAAAYIINDIFDYEIDKINKPRSVIVHRLIPLAKAKTYYWVLNAIGLLLGGYLSWVTQNYYLFLYFPLTVFMMWWYSKTLKKQPFWGNLIVAIFCALVALIILTAENTFLKVIYQQFPEEGAAVWRVFVAYAVFAFLATLFREIVKDLEDMPGDEKGGARTLPIAIGVPKTKNITLAVGVLLAIALVLWMSYFAPSWHLGSTIFMGIGIFIPALYAVFELWRAKSKDDYNCVSKFAKYIMLSGLIYLLFYQF